MNHFYWQDPSNFKNLMYFVTKFTRFGSQHLVACARARPKAGLGVRCRRGSPPPHCEGQGVHLRKIFENSGAKSCILVTICCKISCFLKATAKMLGDQYIEH